MKDYIREYYQGIENGSITVGKWIRLLYEKIVAGIDDGTYIFDQNKANRAIRFIENAVHHNKGDLAPGTLKLQLWQKAAVSLIFGIVDEEGYRVFSECFMVIGRKMGRRFSRPRSSRIWSTVTENTVPRFTASRRSSTRRILCIRPSNSRLITRHSLRH